MVKDSPDPVQVPPDSAIRQILVERIDRRRHGMGMVVGIIEPQGRRIIAHGKLACDDPRPLNGDSVFEIGSITKVFTALLLADMVQKAEVALTNPVAKFLPPEVSVPGRAGWSITLLDLATHTSGLPRMPDNWRPADLTNPYTDYSMTQLYRFLSDHELRRDVGEAFAYSNLGYALLAHALARHAGGDFEALIRSRILALLGMNSTSIALSSDLTSRLAIGHGSQLQTVPNWDLPTFAGAGALRSTSNDLLTFLGAVLGYTDSTLASAMAEMLKVRRRTGNPDMGIALGWRVRICGHDEIVWHGGETGGYRSFLGYLRKARGVWLFSPTHGLPAAMISVFTCSTHGFRCHQGQLSCTEWRRYRRPATRKGCASLQPGGPNLALHVGSLRYRNPSGVGGRPDSTSDLTKAALMTLSRHRPPDPSR
jgi:D-alanyl-D-alanine-carboxypeptidase/D-alanyl-D-alanine-endopeptidase